MSQILAGAVIYTKEFIRIADFYEKVMALEIRESDATHVRLESDCFQLVVLQIPWKPNK